jgi:soluble lytic murein transglycosylase
LLDTMAEGDLRPDAHFLLAWQSRADGDHVEALAELERGEADRVRETAEDLKGRLRYWRARELEAVSRTADAKAAYADLARALPLSYYAVASLARLDTLDAPTAARIRASWNAGAASIPPLRFPRRVETTAPGMARAVALLRAGEWDLATTELSALGLLGEGADPDALWLAAALYDRGGAYASSVALARRRLTSFRSVAPVGASRTLWRIAYPRAYAPLVEDAAAAEHLSPALLRAIAREESGFDPAARSGAGALGLVQLLPGTAARFARPLGLPSDAASLRKPDIALRTGARFLAMLVSQNHGREALVPAAYNAGEGALARFVAAHNPDDLPAFVEDIPYDETRRYTRRVVQSWAVYAALDGGAAPSL